MGLNIWLKDPQLLNEQSLNSEFWPGFLTTRLPSLLFEALSHFLFMTTIWSCSSHWQSRGESYLESHLEKQWASRNPNSPNIEPREDNRAWSPATEYSCSHTVWGPPASRDCDVSRGPPPLAGWEAEPGRQTKRNKFQSLQKRPPCKYLYTF